MSQNETIEELDIDYTKVTADGLNMILFGDYTGFLAKEENAGIPKDAVNMIMGSLVTLNAKSLSKDIAPAYPDIKNKLKTLQEENETQFKTLLL